jgi:hypothetical protein
MSIHTSRATHFNYLSFIFIQATHTSWQDNINFYHNSSNNSSYLYDQLINQKRDLGLPHILSVLNSYGAKKNDEYDVYGRFKRSNVADSGMCIYV